MNENDRSWFFDLWAKAEDDGIPPYMVVTAQRLQSSKTSFALWVAQRSQELLHNRNWSIDYCALTASEYLEIKKQIGEWVPVVGDEWNRAAGNRQHYDPRNQLVAEDLQTSAFEHNPCLFTMPHQHLSDNSIVDQCSSQAVLMRKGYVVVYSREKDQLNRNYKLFTKRIGQGDFPNVAVEYPWLWEAFKRKRAVYTKARREKNLERSKQADFMDEQEKQLVSQDVLVAKVLGNIKPYEKHRAGVPTGRVEATKIAIKERVNLTKAGLIAKEVNLALDGEGVGVSVEGG